MNLYDNVAFPLRQHTDKGEEEIAEIVNRRLKEVGLGGASDKMPNELSGGMRKRAGFARALVLDPQIVLFDERTRGLDPVRTALLCELIKEIHDENGGAYVVITRHHVGPPEWPISSRSCGRAASWSPARRPSSSTRTTSSCASSCRARQRAPSGWSRTRPAARGRRSLQRVSDCEGHGPRNAPSTRQRSPRRNLRPAASR